MDDTGADCFLSLILPAYNEAAGIDQAIAEADEALGRLGVTYEIIVVDDGSGDRTAAIVAQEMSARPGVRLVRHDENRGYGAALRSGFTAARGQRIAFTDADCQFYLDDLALLLPLTDQHPIAVGNRIDRQDSPLRKFYARGYNLLARFLLGTPVRDIDCALKVFRRDALEQILPETGGFFVNTEMLTKARQRHLGIAEVGVRHRPRRRGDSKVSTGDIPRVLNALLPFWWMRVMFPGHDEADPQAREPSSLLQAILLTLLFALTCVLFFARLDHPLLEPEEARYAEIPRQMLRDGRFLTPVLDGEDYWQKPPLLYWLVMASYRIFGVHAWSARLVPALAGIFCVMLTSWWGRRTLGFWPGLVSGAILALSARFLYLGGMVTMDGLLCACVLAALACGHLALTTPRLRVGLVSAPTLGLSEEPGRKRWLLLSALACALGILTKGPVALVLVGMPLASLAFLDRRCRWLSKAEASIYLGAMALVAGPWFVGMAASAPEAAGSFLWLHNLLRYVAPLDHEKPAWFYLPSLLLGMLPWSLLLVPMIPYFLRKSLRTGRRRPAALGIFVLGFGWCLLFFSLSGCKRQGYILPAFPLLALIIGTFATHGLPWRRWMTASSHRLGHRWARRLAGAGFAMGLTLAWAAALVGLTGWLEAAFLALAFGVAGLFVWASSKHAPAWTSWVNCTAIMFVVLLLGQRAWLPAYHDRFGLRRQVEISSEYEQEEPLPILSYPKRWDSIGFYAQRNDVKSCTDIDQLVHDLHVHGRALVFVRRDESLRELLDRLPAEMEIEQLGREADYVVVGLVRMRQK
jgi:dolichol-phosphate mannosyltransferase